MLEIVRSGEIKTDKDVFLCNINLVKGGGHDLRYSWLEESRHLLTGRK